MPKMEELHTVRNVEILHETANAVLIEIDDEEIWIPFSQITDIDRDTGTISMTAWIAKMKGLI